MSLKFFLRFFLLFLPLFGFADNFLNETPSEIVVQNRILASVNGKNISVMDVMKKMDLLLTRSYPEHANSISTKYQFFSQNWKHTLNQMIDNELIIAEAEKLEMKVADAEIREKLYERFGPNIMSNLDQAGITYDEAWRLIYSEIVVQRMSWYRVHSKALQRIGPQDIKLAFQKYLTENPPKEEWKYQVLSIRAKTEQLGKIYAQKAYALIRNEPLSFETLAKTLLDEKKEEIDVDIHVSEEYQKEGKELSDSHRAILCNLTPGSYSEPTPQVNRFDKSTVHRIFYLKNHKKHSPPKFDSMVDTLHDQLVQKEIEIEFPKYLAILHKKFNFDEKQLENFPSNFQPFLLR